MKTRITRTGDVRIGREFRVLAGAVLALAFVACGDKDEGGGGGGGTAQNACQNGGPGCSTSAMEQSGGPGSGTGSVRIVFGQQSVEASSESAAATAEDGEGYLGCTAFTPDFNVSTTQPGDEFRDVRCAAYSMGQFIQGTIGEWLCFSYVQGATGQEAPVSLRVIDIGEGTFNLETAWGFCTCSSGGDDGDGGLTCDGSTVGNGTRDACCTADGDCQSSRCCTQGEPCFNSLDDRYTCRDPLN